MATKNYDSILLNTQRRADLNESGETINVLLVHPGMYPQKVQLECTIEAMQQLVGEHLEFTEHPFDDYAVIVSLDLEHSEDCEPNRALRCPDGMIILVFNGSFLIVGGSKEKGFCSLTPKQMRRYEMEYHQPEAFDVFDDHVVVTPLPNELVRT